MQAASQALPDAKPAMTSVAKCACTKMRLAPTEKATALAQGLIRCPSVTPAEGGALGLLEGVLKPMGFACHRLPFTEIGTPELLPGV